MSGSCRVWNCGTYMRRKMDEIDYKPRVGALMTDGTFRAIYLDTSKDRFVSKENTELHTLGANVLNEFLQELYKVSEKGLDYIKMVERYAAKPTTPEELRKALLEIIEEAKPCW